MSSMWLYTGLRFALFAVLWGILWLVGVDVLLAALIALLLSMPLSYVLLARPRARLAGDIEARIESHRVKRTALDDQLDPDRDDA
jgi:hypothetical protein